MRPEFANFHSLISSYAYLLSIILEMRWHKRIRDVTNIIMMYIQKFPLANARGRTRGTVPAITKFKIRVASLKSCSCLYVYTLTGEVCIPLGKIFAAYYWAKVALYANTYNSITANIHYIVNVACSITTTLCIWRQVPKLVYMSTYIYDLCTWCSW